MADSDPDSEYQETVNKAKAMLRAIERAKTLTALKPLVAGDVPAFEPGSRFAYSNSGFLLLGLGDLQIGNVLSAVEERLNQRSYGLQQPGAGICNGSTSTVGPSGASAQGYAGIES